MITVADYNYGITVIAIGKCVITDYTVSTPKPYNHYYNY